MSSRTQLLSFLLLLLGSIFFSCEKPTAEFSETEKNISQNKKIISRSYNLVFNLLSIPSNASIGDEITISASIENIGFSNFEIGEADKLGYLVSNEDITPGNLNDLVPTFHAKTPLNNFMLVPGEKIEFQQTIALNKDHFVADKENVIIIWPVTAREDTDQSDNYEKVDIFVSGQK